MKDSAADEPTGRQAATTPRQGGQIGGVRREIVNLLEYIYAPVIVAGAFLVLYGFADPAQETIIGMATDMKWLFAGDPGLPSNVMILRLALTLSALLYLPFILAILANLTLRSYGFFRTASAPRDVLLILIPGMAGLALVIGPVRAAFNVEGVGLGLPMAILALPGVLVLGALVLLVRAHGIGIEYEGRPRARKGRLDEFFRLDNRLARRAALAGAAAVLAVAVIVTVYPPVGEFIGPIGIACIFAAALALILSALTMASRVMPGHFPLILVVAFLALALTRPWLAILGAAAAGLTLAMAKTPTRLQKGLLGAIATTGLVYFAATHLSARCDTLSGCNIARALPSAPAADERANVSLAFRHWLDHNDDVPVRLVAAQGGGLFTAYQTAYYLAARADMEEDFARSVFAISGVSGGSVGAGIFWAIRETGLCPTGGGRPLVYGTGVSNTCHRDAVDAVLRHDYLSTAMAGLFFRDNLDNVLPLSALYRDPIDRGRELERRFANKLQQWIEDFAGDDRVPSDNPLGRAMTESWSPGAGVPLLLFNTTDVATGRKVILSPLCKTNLGTAGRLSMPNGADLSVATAMVTSARFPVVTPPLRADIEPEAEPCQPDPSSETRTVQLVDGGYFDNSGLETLSDFAETLSLRRETAARDAPPVIGPHPSARAERAAQASRAPIEVVVFSVDPPAPPSDAGPAPFTTAGLFGPRLQAMWARLRGGLEGREMKGTLSAPVSAFMGAWEARRDLTARRFEELTYPDGDGHRRLCTLPMRIDQQRANFTVSWFLHQGTFDKIRDDIERALVNAQRCPG